MTLNHPNQQHPLEERLVEEALEIDDENYLINGPLFVMEIFTISLMVISGVLLVGLGIMLWLYLDSETKNIKNSTFDCAIHEAFYIAFPTDDQLAQIDSNLISGDALIMSANFDTGQLRSLSADGVTRLTKIDNLREKLKNGEPVDTQGTFGPKRGGDYTIRFVPNEDTRTGQFILNLNTSDVIGLDCRLMSLDDFHKVLARRVI